MSMVKPILTKNASPPGGHYSQATAFENTIYISGQLPVRADGSHTNTESFETQVRQALQNLLATVEAAGGSRESVARVTAYIVGVSNWPAFNNIYADVFKDWKPARSVVPVPELHHGYLVEIDAVAHRA